VIGEGCVIGAGTLVNKSILPGCTAVGVPAKIIAGPAADDLGDKEQD
jgi:serine acetyltransferase